MGGALGGLASLLWVWLVNGKPALTFLVQTVVIKT
jgi:hypothetical protein